MWFGAVCPWTSFAHTDVIPIHRLILLGVLILLFRRIPEIFAMHLHIDHITQTRQALFVGYFGPIGVSAIFYLYISIDFLRGVTVDGQVREDAVRLAEIMTVVIWFLAICSIVRNSPYNIVGQALSHYSQIVHGLSIPIGKLGQNLPRTLSKKSSTTADERPAFELRPQDQALGKTALPNGQRFRKQSRAGEPQRPVWRIGGSIIPPSNPQASLPRDERAGGSDPHSSDLMEDTGLQVANIPNVGSTYFASHLVGVTDQRDREHVTARAV